MRRYVNNLITLTLILTVSACAPKGFVTEPTFESEQYTFATPKQAVRTLKAALDKGDSTELVRIFGPQSSDIVSSGDPVADQRSFKSFAKRIDEKVEIVEGVNQNPALKNQQLAFLYIGKVSYPFPIALHKRANGWRFDTAVGKEELINRRIGRNELRAIDATQEIVRAQWRYYEQQEREGRPPQYAKQILSSPGKRDGLIGESARGSSLSRLGPALNQPHYGYQFEILKGQGAKARGGAMSYVDERGRLSKGFGVLAYPTSYGKSGVVTFLTGPDGVTYQKNLGPNTSEIAKRIRTVNPDLSWIPVR